MIHPSIIYQEYPCFKVDSLETPWHVLMAYLILERCKGSKSFWYPYIRIMPQEPLDELPFYWDPNDFTLCAKCFIVEVEINRRKLLETISDVRKFFYHNQNLCDPSEQLYLWSYAMLQTRSLYISSEEPLVMLPFFDFFNHSNSATVKPVVAELDLKYITTSPLRVNEQVFISYHQMNNRISLCDYGFVTIKSCTSPFTVCPATEDAIVLNCDDLWQIYRLIHEENPSRGVEHRIGQITTTGYFKSDSSFEICWPVSLIGSEIVFDISVNHYSPKYDYFEADFEINWTVDLINSILALDRVSSRQVEEILYNKVERSKSRHYLEYSVKFIDALLKLQYELEWHDAKWLVSTRDGRFFWEILAQQKHQSLCLLVRNEICLLLTLKWLLHHKLNQM